MIRLIDIEQAMKELAKLPIAIKTKTQQMRIKELEAKIESLEKTIERMKRPGKIWIQQQALDSGNFLDSLNMAVLPQAMPPSFDSDFKQNWDAVKDKSNPLLGGSELVQHQVRSSRRSVPRAQVSEPQMEENITNWLSS